MAVLRLYIQMNIKNWRSETPPFLLRQGGRDPRLPPLPLGMFLVQQETAVVPAQQHNLNKNRRSQNLAQTDVVIFHARRACFTARWDGSTLW